MNVMNILTKESDIMKKLLSIILSISMLLSITAGIDISAMASYDTIATAKTITLGTTYSGTISSSDKDDFYKFTLSSSSTATVYLKSQIGNIYIDIVNSDGESIYHRYPYADNSGISSINEKIELIKGTYYCHVYRNDYDGNYNVKISATTANVSFDYAHDTFNTAVNISSSGTKYNGLIALNDKNDFYKFTLSSSSIISLSLNGELGNIYIDIYNNNGESIYHQYPYANSSGTISFLDTIHLIKGTYYFHVRRNDYDGKYNFSINATSANVSFDYAYDTLATAVNINLNTQYNGLIALNDTADFYKFTNNSSKINISLTGELNSAYLNIYNANAESIYHDYVYSNNSNNISYNKDVSLNPGTYYFHIYKNEDYGKYLFKISGTGSSTHTHTYKTTVVSPTCTEQGYTLHQCTGCTYNYKDNYKSANGHEYNVTVVKPTATQQGYTLHQCKNCTYNYKDNYVSPTKPEPFMFGDVNNDGKVSVADVTTVSAFAANSLTPTMEQFILSDVDNDGEITETDRDYVAQYVAESKGESGVTGWDIYPIYNYIASTGYCGEKVKYILFKNGTLKIFGSGAMYDCSSTNSLFYANKSVKSLIIYDGITSIGNYAFNNCTALQNVTIPMSVKKIGTGAFSGCTGLKRVDYEGDCGDWMGIHIASGNEKFVATPRYFEGKRDETQLNYSGKCGKNVKYSYNGSTRTLTISGKGKMRNWSDDDLFEGDGSFFGSELGFNDFDKIVIKKGVTYIGCYMFANVYAKSVIIANGVTIGESAFSYSEIDRIDLGGNLKTIPLGCFYESNIGSIFIPKTVKTIKQYAFEKNDDSEDGKVSNVYYNGTKSQWNKVKKQSKNSLLYKAKIYYITTPATSLSKLKKYKKAFKATWKKKSGIKGYQIQYAVNSKFTKSVKLSTVANKDTGSKKITGLKAKKTYYVRVRTYRVVKGKTFYSKWSKTKKVKTK